MQIIVTKECTEHLGNVGAVARPWGEDELAVWQPQQQLVHVLAQQGGPLRKTPSVVPAAQKRSTALVIRSSRNFPSRLVNSAS